MSGIVLDPPTSALAGFASGLGWADLPQELRHAARRNLLNVAGCALGGRADPMIASFSAVLRGLSGGPAASEIGGGRTDPATAAFMNAAAANVQDYDDQHLPTVMHPGPVVVGAALATAEMAGADGRTLLTAIIAGLEGACRIGNATHPGHYAGGFHITATCGVFGAALASARILGLPPERIGWAIGHAAAQSAGLVETLAGPAKSTGVGAAARAGLHAALYAQAGIAAPAAPLTGRFGFLSVMAAGAEPARITDGLGSAWETLRSSPKAYPVGVVLHPVVDACLALREEPGFDAAALLRLEVRGHPLLRIRADRPDITTGREATVSAQHVCAAALLRGRIGPGELTDAAVMDPAILALRTRVVVVEDSAISVEGATLVADFVGGQRELHVPMGRSLPDRPMTDAELEAKVGAQAAWGSPWCDADAVIARCWSAEDLPHPEPLMALLRRNAGATA